MARNRTPFVRVPPTLAWLIELIVTLPHRLRARRRYHRERNAQEGALEAVRDLINKSIGLEQTAGRELTHSRLIVNVALYVMLLNRDLLEIKTDMVTAIGIDRRRFVSRQLALLLHESIEKLPGMLGKDYRASLQTLGLSSSIVDGVNAVCSGLDAFKKAHHETLYLIRNLTIAHRDGDAILQLEVIESLDPLAIMELAVEFSVPLNDLVQLETKVVQDGLGMEGLFRDLVAPPLSPAKASKAAARWKGRPHC